MISIVIPAFNEEKLLPGTLAALRAAISGMEAEIIVVDNESTDSTPKIATDAGARVISESVHNIGRVRNIGANATNGDIIVFLDADTIVREGVFEQIAIAMSDEKCFGGSVAVEYVPSLRWTMRMYLGICQMIGRAMDWHQGAMQFCRADSFRELNGYDETIYVGEDIEFQWRLSRLARRSGGRITYIEAPAVQTSSRRFVRYGLLKTMVITHPIFILSVWRRPSPWKEWYEDALR